jgi:hypothetical protein
MAQGPSATPFRHWEPRFADLELATARHCSMRRRTRRQKNEKNEGFMHMHIHTPTSLFPAGYSPDRLSKSPKKYAVLLDKSANFAKVNAPTVCADEGRAGELSTWNCFLFGHGQRVVR